MIIQSRYTAIDTCNQYSSVMNQLSYFFHLSGYKRVVNLSIIKTKQVQLYTSMVTVLQRQGGNAALVQCKWLQANTVVPDSCSAQLFNIVGNKVNDRQVH